MRPRLYVPDLDPAATRVPLPTDEAEHLLRVLRLGMGAEVDVIDGRGGLWRAQVVEAGKRSAAVRAFERGTPAPELALSIVLVISVLKADKMDTVVRDAVMLGATGVIPVISERSELGLSAVEKSRRVARWQRIAVASAKQCGRAVVPLIEPARSFAAYLAGATTSVRLICVEPAGGRAEARRVRTVAKPASAHVMVGPEGGWAREELTMAVAAGAVPVSLGGRTLRADAAPLVALTALLTTWNEL